MFVMCPVRGTGHSALPSHTREASGVRIYVGNLPYEATEDELRQLFSAHGEVSEVYMPTDRETGRPRGFAFVEMPSDEQATAAIEGVNGKDVGGRAVTVNEARSRGGGRSQGSGGGGSRRW